MMNKYTLIHEDGTTRIEVSFDEVGLQEVLEHVDKFLRAVGFVPKGDLMYWEDPNE